MIIVCGGSVRSVWGSRSWGRELHEKRGLQEWSCVSEDMCRGERDKAAQTSCASKCSLWGTIVPCLARHLPPRMTGSSSTCPGRVWTNHLPSSLPCLSSVPLFPSALSLQDLAQAAGSSSTSFKFLRTLHLLILSSKSS